MTPGAGCQSGYPYTVAKQVVTVSQIERSINMETYMETHRPVLLGLPWPGTIAKSPFT